MSKTNKFIAWCVPVAITSFWLWVSVHTWLQGSLFEANPDVMIIMSGLFILLLAFLALGLIMFQSHLYNLYLGLVSGVTFLIIFGISNLNLVGVFILVMLFYHAQDIVHGELNERIKMNSRVLLRKGLTNFIVAFFVLMSFGAYQSPAIESFKNISELPSATNVFIRQVAEKTLTNQLSQVEPTQREEVLNRVTQEMMREFNLFLAPYFDFAPPALAFGLFLVLWGLGWIFIWLAVLIGMLIFQILQRAKFFRIEEYDVKAQRIVT